MTILDFKTHYPVFDSITSFLGIEDILRLHKTCRRLRDSPEKLTETKWNINQRLSSMFEDPIRLRNFQARWDMIFYGPLIVQFFARDDRKAGLDLEISIGSSDDAFKELKNLLVECERYSIVKERGGYKDPVRTFFERVRFDLCYVLSANY